MCTARSGGRGGKQALLAALVVLLVPLLQAPPAFAVRGGTCEELLIPLSDGTRLHGWAHHGVNAGTKRPILWTMTPYTNTGCPGGTAFGTATPEMFDKSTAVSISYRGTGASEGEQDAWGPGDREDVQEVGDWLANRPYSDGLVPTGASAEGAWIVFALDHPAIRAALWITSCADGYQGCVRSGGQLAGGAVILTQGELQGYVQGMGDRIRNGTTNPSPPAQVAATVVNGYPALIEDHNGPFWSSRLGFQYLRDVTKPVMFTTDLYDYVSKGMYLAYERTPAKHAWLSTALGHNNPRQVLDDKTPLGALAKAPIRQFLNKYVYGQTQLAKPARLRLMTNLGTVSGYKRAEVLVRSERDWPLPSTKWRRLYLGSKTLSRTPPAPGDDLSPLATTNGPTGELRTQLAVFGAIGAASGNSDLLDAMLKATHDDLRPEEALGLTYTTPPLAKDTEISGPVVLDVNATATAPNFDWQVRLTDVHPDGRSSWITDGQLRASLRRVDERPVREERPRRLHPALAADDRARARAGGRTGRVRGRAGADLERVPQGPPDPPRHPADRRRLPRLDAQRRGRCAPDPPRRNRPLSPDRGRNPASLPAQQAGSGGDRAADLRPRHPLRRRLGSAP